MVRNTEADRRANAQRRAVSALSSAKHAAHRRPPSENARHSASTATAGMQETKARMRRDVDASEAQIKILSSQLPLAERRAFPKEARQVEEVLGKAAAQLDSINRKAARNPTKKTRSTREALHTVSHGVLQAAKAADDKENSALAGESDASDVLNAVNHLPSPPKRSHRSSKVASQNKARTQDLADVSDHREWGKIYEPTGEKGRVSGLEKKEYDGWSKEVNDISSVYDPVHDTRPSVSNVRGDWWRDRAYVIKGTSGVDHGDDDWWVHNHAGRGY
uniref:Uncharacterized protein n=2 Tax=Hemiselmis andersenii TaxID=464988 RepID=A0A7S0XPW7_HEMAN|mmetsp:Transcript_126/g.259  ORF Transcript_126/g.259 Transcript_126/m.259 type:complete len:276 (+) Transcript_126:534-1361(+)